MADVPANPTPAPGNRKPRERQQTCFVVMPFGTKPNGLTQRPHDFDKIYRVVIKRAVELAGMRCIRADETAGSRLIHTDMFRDLRDQPLVIADLSLQNPNVLYELGIRHVMSKSGTVLMCENGSRPLPFDIGLSRVVFYEYDGVSLDWEEAERLVERLRIALLESASGAPDSPVHALLERVLSQASDEGMAAWPAAGTDPLDGFEPYIALVAQTWRASRVDIGVLFDAHRGHAFGCRALADLVLAADPLPGDWTAKIANQLLDFAQYGAAEQLYARLRDQGLARYDDLVRMADAHGKVHGDLAGADFGLALMAEAEAQLARQFGADPGASDAVAASAYVLRRKAGLWQWRWELSDDPFDLQQAIAVQGDAIELLDRVRREGGIWAAAAAGPLAQSHMRRLLLGRIAAGDPALGDAHDDLQAILAIKELPGDDPKALSYLRWYRTIALADSGAADRTRRSALEAFAKDADLMHQGPEFVEIGRRQYVGLRRVLEQYATWLRHPELLGLIGQTLQARH